jgi:hypothetical protein
MTRNPPPLRLAAGGDARFDIRSAWFALASIGNAYFAAKNLLAAQSVFTDCAQLAQTNLHEWNDADEALNAIVISGLNRVATEIALVNPDAARQLMCKTHQAVLSIARNDQQTPELRLAALKQVARMLLELRRLQHALGCDAEIDFWLQNSCVCLAWKQVRKQFSRTQMGKSLH